MKWLINELLGLAGKEIRSTNAPLHTFSQGLQQLKRRIAVGSVIDVGVADGTPEIYSEFTGKPFLLVEANPAYAERLQYLANTLPAALEQVFCGATEGTVPFHLYKAGRKASAYQTHSQKVKDGYLRTVQTKVEPLDTLVARHALPAPYLLKIDTEGAEVEVLKGATKTLTQTNAVILEASVVKRYENAPELADLIAYMKSCGFSVYDMIEGSIEDGRLLMVDLIFVKTDAPFRVL